MTGEGIEACLEDLIHRTDTENASLLRQAESQHWRPWINLDPKEGELQDAVSFMKSALAEARAYLDQDAGLTLDAPR